VVDQAVLERLQESSVGDGMTPLFNHRHFLTCLRRELRRARRHPLEFSVALLDLDGLRRVNDSCGRRAGDSALREAARVIQARIREMDVAARSGGCEFSLLFPGTGRLGAYVVADRIRASTREVFLQTPPGMDRIDLTLSGGVAVYPSDGEGEDELMEKARLALRKARARGGDTIVPHHGEKRDSFRFRPVGAVLQARAIDRADPPGPLLRTRNFSAGGALFTSAAAHQVGEDLEIRFSRRESDSGLTVKANVLRREDGGPEGGEAQTRVAVRFLLESPGTRQALDVFLTSLRGHGIEEGAP
jgi:diguanylate cyclase (GGDEF)-like protein